MFTYLLFVYFFCFKIWKSEKITRKKWRQSYSVHCSDIQAVGIFQPPAERKTHWIIWLPNRIAIDAPKATIHKNETIKKLWFTIQDSGILPSSSHIWKQTFQYYLEQSIQYILCDDIVDFTPIIPECYTVEKNLIFLRHIEI